MGHNVHIHVCFACDENEGVAKLAGKHLEGVSDCLEAKWFLEDLSGRTGRNPGPKGGLSVWGMVGNYTDGDEFVEVLKPFWRELLDGVLNGPLDFEHIMVFVEHEQSERAFAYEIAVNQDNWPGPNGALEVTKHVCAFSWRQM